MLGQQPYDWPLLPFEKQLIEITGCTEQEYRALVAKAIHKGSLRPSGYEHIPDVRMDPTTIAVISLVVGLASTAASFLLTPKPKAIAQQQQDRRDPQQRSLASIVGASRFSPTFGFDSQTELANYGDPIAVIFGRRTDTTGGIVVSPSLVWSRMFSYGNQQGVKLLFVVGEQGVDLGQAQPGLYVPDREGIFLGNGPLNAIFDSVYAFYWKRNTTASGYSRIKANNLAYGTRGSQATGDPETDDDIFTCPTLVSDNDYGFSSAHTLSNNAEFGCYGAIANGTAYRVNWRTVSIIGEDNGLTARFERLKISGDNNGAVTVQDIGSLGMSGTGRNYSCRMGVTSLNGVGVSDAVGTEERTVAVGDQITFVISSAKIREDIYSGATKVADINSEITEQCIAADEALQIGELFMIGRNIWQVTERKLPIFEEDGENQVIRLKCLEITESGYNKIGLVSAPMLERDYLNDDAGLGNDAVSTYFAGVAYYPLMRFSEATVRNTRACEVTEIGLRSNVYQRLSGLTNFQALPTPQELRDADNGDVTINSGTITSYIKRSSSFTVLVRPSGVDDTGNAYPWRHLGMRFAVVGSQPKAIYNFLRIKHPNKGQYEYKIVPKNGADMRLTPDVSPFWVLNASGNQGELLSENFQTDYGIFQVRASGYKATKKELQSNNEFFAEASSTSAVTAPGYPSSVGIQLYYPEELPTTATATQMTYVDVYTSPSGFTMGRLHAFAWEIFGGADVSGLPLNGTKVVTARETDSQGRWLDIRYTGRKVYLPDGHYSGNVYTWFFDNIEITSSSTGWAIGNQVSFNRTLASGNPFRVVPGQGTMVEAGVIHNISSVQGTSGIIGRTQAWLEELFGAARTKQIGTQSSVTLNLTKGTKRIALKLDTFVEYVPNHWSGVTSLWAHPTISVIQQSASTTKDWVKGDTIDSTLTVSAFNRFMGPWAGIKVGPRFEILDIGLDVIQPATFNPERAFESQSQYADVSFYRNLIDKSNQSEPEHAVVYVNEIVSNETLPTYENMTTCGLAIKASRNFSRLDQLRLWLSNGIHVRRFHPDDAAAPYGASNLFCDLVYYLLTDGVAGAGRVLGMTATNAPLINTDDMVTTAKFLKANNLFFDGALASPLNLRQFIGETAPFFLCNFVISDGKFSLIPALPHTTAGEISLGAIQISQLFTAGNILEDSFSVEYLDAEERKDFQAVMRYRQQDKNQFPQERNIVVRTKASNEYVPVEPFDMTLYCTSRDHAFLAAKFFLSIRKRVTHTVSFSTTPYGLNLAPGDFIRVETESSPYSAANNGAVSATGAITAATPLMDGQYNVLYYKTDSNDIAEGVMPVDGNTTSDPTFFGAVFTVMQAINSQNVYQVEQLTLEEEGTVRIVASEFPCDTNLVSLIAKDVLDDNLYLVEG